MSNALQATDGTTSWESTSHSHSPFLRSSFEDVRSIRNYDSNSNEILRQIRCGEQRIIKSTQYIRSTDGDSDDDDSSGEFVISRKLLRRRHIRKEQRKKRKAQEEEQRLVRKRRRGQTEMTEYNKLKRETSKHLVNYPFFLDGDILSDTETGGGKGDIDSKPEHTLDNICLERRNKI